MFAMQAHEVKAQLSEVPRKVEHGEEIMITRHGKTVARLKPWNDRKQTIVTVEAVRTLKRIKLPKDENSAYPEYSLKLLETEDAWFPVFGTLKF